MSEPRLFVPAGSEALPVAEALSWQWRLGGVRDAPDPRSVGVGMWADSHDLEALTRDRSLAGAIVLAGPPGGDRGRILNVRLAPAAWGRLDAMAELPKIARFLTRLLDRPLVALPPIGCLRIDDLPGTAELQALGQALDDAAAAKRVRGIVAAVERAGAPLVAAVASEALAGDAFVPLHEVWPAAVTELRAAAARGSIEVACHGTTHLEPGAWSAGRVEASEFSTLDEAEAGARLDRATAWLSDQIAPAASFVAPAWGYSDGARRAAAARGLTMWMGPRPGPLSEGNLVFETLADGLPGLRGLRYAPLQALAGAGLPPTVVFHGRLLDDRLPRLRASGDLISLARLAVRRDLERIAALRGIRWVGARELADRLRAHAAIETDGAEVQAPDGVEFRLLRT